MVRHGTNGWRGVMNEAIGSVEVASAIVPGVHKFFLPKFLAVA